MWSWRLSLLWRLGIFSLFFVNFENVFRLRNLDLCIFFKPYIRSWYVKSFPDIWEITAWRAAVYGMLPGCIMICSQDEILCFLLVVWHFPSRNGRDSKCILLVQFAFSCQNHKSALRPWVSIGPGSKELACWECVGFLIAVDEVAFLGCDAVNLSTFYPSRWEQCY
jgi:hypothetical protein